MDTLKQEHGKSNFIQPRTISTPKQKVELLEPAALRSIFTGQARLLAERSERDLPLDVRSLWHLALVFRAIAEAEGDDDGVAA